MHQGVSKGVLRAETVIGKDCYPHYRRRRPGIDGGRTATLRDRSDGAQSGATVEVSNQWVVPYNPYLSLRYDAHINVEYCSSIKAVKYLYKYVFKGHDMATITLGHDQQERVQFDINGAIQGSDRLAAINEPNEYLNSRYIGSIEAAWRLLGLKMHDRYPAVLRLTVHLPGGQLVYFQEGEALQTAQAGEPHTQLMALFDANTDAHPDHVIARVTLYQDFPEMFTWDNKLKKWSLRRGGRGGSGGTIGRMYNVHPSEGERFYLRILLTHVRGAKSFIELRTVDGHAPCETFKEVCRLRGLLDDDSEWDTCLQEAATHTTAQLIRQLFISILLFCEPTDVPAILEAHSDAMTEDFVHRFRTRQPDLLVDRARQCLLHDLQRRLNANNSSLHFTCLIPKLSGLSLWMVTMTNSQKKSWSGYVMR